MKLSKNITQKPTNLLVGFFYTFHLANHFFIFGTAIYLKFCFFMKK